MYYSLKQIKELKKHVEKTNNVKIKEDAVMVISNPGIYKMYADEIMFSNGASSKSAIDIKNIPYTFNYGVLRIFEEY